MEEMAKDDPVNYTYGTDVVIHLKKVAHTAVRYTGTMAGSLMMKHAHQGKSELLDGLFSQFFIF